MPDDRATIMIHALADARAALTAAQALGVPVRLVSPPAAPAYLGIDYFQNVADAAREDFPDVDAQFVLDCDDMTGFALAAFRQGVDRIHIRVENDVRLRIEEVATQVGGCLEDIIAPALDLENIDDPVAACREWLLKSRSEP